MHTLDAYDTWARIGPATTFNNSVTHPLEGARKLTNAQVRLTGSAYDRCRR